MADAVCRGFAAIRAFLIIQHTVDAASQLRAVVHADGLEISRIAFLFFFNAAIDAEQGEHSGEKHQFLLPGHRGLLLGVKRQKWPHVRPFEFMK